MAITMARSIGDRMSLAARIANNPTDMLAKRTAEMKRVGKDVLESMIYLHKTV
jgi:hypothetical protein